MPADKFRNSIVRRMIPPTITGSNLQALKNQGLILIEKHFRVQADARRLGTIVWSPQVKLQGTEAQAWSLVYRLALLVILVGIAKARNCEGTWIDAQPSL